MSLDPEVLDEILKLTAQQLLTELRSARDAGTRLDPRTLKLAMDIIERASGTKAFAPKQPDVIVDTTTGEARVIPPEAGPLWRTKAGRSKLRRMPYLGDAERALLAQFNVEDGVTP